MSHVLPKPEAREMVWRAMEVHGAARSPDGKGRIPNFVGAERAALALRTLPAWRAARVVTVNADAAQLAVRRMALREGKVVYMAVPRPGGTRCLLELDPGRLGPRGLQAASAAGAMRLGCTVALGAVPPVDLVVCGAVAVNGRGARVGKGDGLSDLDYGLLAETGRVGPGTPVVTTVHARQVVPHDLEMLAHDVPIDAAATPEGVLAFTPAFARPRGIYRVMLTPQRIAEVPALGELLGRA